MGNQLIDNTYLITDSSASALSWPSGARIANVIFYAINTNASAEFQYVAGSPILKFTVVTQGAGTSIMPATQSVDMGNVRFPTAWIPTILTACTAWINFT